MDKKLLDIINLSVKIDNKLILKDISLSIAPAETHVIMGPNGAGKSSLSYTLMGHPQYKVVSGDIYFNSFNITHMETYLRARKGLFLAFQQPYEIEGLTLRVLLKQAYDALYSGTEKELSFFDFNCYLEEVRSELGIDKSFLDRSLNLGFSGGEKKKAEVLQIAVLHPKLVILDEIDSGLDVDSIKIVSKAIGSVKTKNPDLSLLIITHHSHILKYLIPDYVHILKNGSLIMSGDKDLALTIEKKGYIDGN